MELKKTRTGDQLVVEFCGRLDTYSTPDAEEEIQGILGGVKHLELDFKELTFVSSAGLRLLLIIQKNITGKGGTMVITHVDQEVMNILTVSGFDKILKIIP